MRVFHHSLLFTKELDAGEIFRTLPCKAYLELRKEKGDTSIEIIFNGSIISSDTTRLDFDTEVELVIRQNNGTSSYYIKPVVRSLSNKSAEVYKQFKYEYDGKIENEIEGIKSGALKMYAVDHSTQVYDWTDTFDKMEHDFSAIKAICETPKSHLKAVNEVRPIETIKRIGYESISYLAAHSEDWLAKTASGLKPARLFSRVESDEYQIYENRVVKTLIEQTISFLKMKEKKLRDNLGQQNSIMNSEVQTGCFGFDKSFQKAVSELWASNNGSENRFANSEVENELHKKLMLLLKKYRALRQTKLYKHLKNARPVTNPLGETNILLLDKHYNVVFRLWKAVHTVIAPQEVILDEKLARGSVDSDYLLFCRTLCGYTAHVLNFDINEDGKYYRSIDNLEMTIKEDRGLIRVALRETTQCRMNLSNNVRSPILAGANCFGFSCDGKTLFWDHDISTKDIDKFCSLFKTENYNGNEHGEKKRYFHALKSAIEKIQRESTQPYKSEFVILPTVVELENDNRNSFKSYMEEWAKIFVEKEEVAYVIIALPICNENEQKLISYAKSYGERVLFLPLTMYDINSFRRLQSVMLRLIISLGKKNCPYCGKLMRKHDNQLVCDDCNQLTLTKTICPNTECRHEYQYLSYDISQETIENMQSVEPENFFQWDSLYQYKDIVDLSVDSGGVRTICPRCGKS